ncbi:hypothetical protein SDC9_72940 [bioreactor metagenome]|uniref:Uncharacterized protein n=1 Tax=bioreactor metagenome TaxID=1076179 RepID=A0A644YEN7_9ZZZZ
MIIERHAGRKRQNDFIIAAGILCRHAIGNQFTEGFMRIRVDKFNTQVFSGRVRIAPKIQLNLFRTDKLIKINNNRLFDFRIAVVGADAG